MAPPLGTPNNRGIIWVTYTSNMTVYIVQCYADSATGGQSCTRYVINFSRLPTELSRVSNAVDHELKYNFIDVHSKEPSMQLNLD